MNGYCQGESETTLEKEEHYAKILGWHMGIAARALAKTRGDYLMIDATAGTGRVERFDADGSALIFLKAVNSGSLLSSQWRAVFCELDRDSFAALLKNVPPADNIDFRWQSYTQLLREFRSASQIGLLYIDENGTPDFDAINYFAYHNHKMEVLISVGANVIKRGKKTQYNLDEWVSRIPKQYWNIRKLSGKWQWTFLLGSNYVGFNKEYKRIGFYPIESEEGRRILEVASTTKEERQKKAQPPLIELMPNI